MAQVMAVRVRPVACARCGASGRLTIETETEMIDRCSHCGDEVRSVLLGHVEVVGRAGQLVRTAPS